MAKVLIVGVRPEHLEKIKTEFPRHEFHARSNNTSRYKAKQGSCYDFVLCMSKFTNHTQTQQIKKSGTPMFMVTGGYTSIKNILTNGYNGHCYTS